MPKKMMMDSSKSALLAVAPSVPNPTEPDRAALQSLGADATLGNQAEGSAPSVAPSTPPKRGRPPGSKTTSKGALPDFPRTMVRDVLVSLYTPLEKRYGEHWRLTEKEADGMVDAHIGLLQEYAPAFMKDHPALSTVIILHSIALVTRYMIHVRLAQEAAEKRDAPVSMEASTDGRRNPDSGETRFGKIGPAPSST